jgi:hypothetical protein
LTKADKQFYLFVGTYVKNYNFFLIKNIVYLEK